MTELPDEVVPIRYNVDYDKNGPVIRKKPKDCWAESGAQICIMSMGKCLQLWKLHTCTMVYSGRYIYHCALLLSLIYFARWAEHPPARIGSLFLWRNPTHCVLNGIWVVGTRRLAGSVKSENAPPFLWQGAHTSRSSAQGGRQAQLRQLPLAIQGYELVQVAHCSHQPLCLPWTANGGQDSCGGWVGRRCRERTVETGANVRISARVDTALPSDVLPVLRHSGKLTYA